MNQHQQAARIDRVIAWTAAIGLALFLLRWLWDALPVVPKECTAKRVGEVVELRLDWQGRAYCHKFSYRGKQS